jgi:L-lactate dehydrogenase complex protein LldE
LFPEGSPDAERARELAARTFELVSFLTDVLGVIGVDAELPARATYHDACAGLRELGVKQQPRLLLQSVRGLELVELPGAEVCCGFGGTFCVKYPAISTKMVDDKAADILATGADLVLAGDLGCLMNIAGRLSRLGSTIEVRHVAEVLAGAIKQPPIAGRTP